MTDTLDRPRITFVEEGKTYLYQGRCKSFSGNQVRVLSLFYTRTQPNLVHVEALKGKTGEATGKTFGCDPRWLTSKSAKSAYAQWDDQLRRQNSKLKPRRDFVIEGLLQDPEDIEQQSFELGT